MKRKDFERFASKLVIPRLPGFEAKGHLIFKVPVGNLLCGFIFGSSGFSSQRFHADAFVQPLYVPSSHITMTLGRRLLGAWELSGEEALADRLLESINKEGKPLLESLDSPKKIALTVETLFSPKNHYVRQSRAYSLAFIGRDREAIQLLDALDSMLAEMAKGVQKWAADVQSEVAIFRQALLSDPIEAKLLLERWATETREKLRLPT